MFGQELFDQFSDLTYVCFLLNLHLSFSIGERTDEHKDMHATCINVLFKPITLMVFLNSCAKKP